LFLLVVVLFMTPHDLKQIGNVIDKKFDEQDKKFDKKFDEQDQKFDKRFEEQGKEFDKKLDDRDQKLLPLMSKLMDVKLENYDRRLDDKLFKWKSEVIDAVDALASEMKDSQDFRLITTNQIAENWERTDRLEKKVFGAVMTA